ncbi:MAG: hypothetical protein ABSH11_07140 [Verrucomicrobiota bacterium]|jgi:hypothetical protein
MKTNLLSSRAVLLMAISCRLALHLAPARAGVIVDDTWADSIRHKFPVF